MTIVEVLVVIAILGLLLAVALPAIHGARAISHRVECSNHLHQLGVAAQSYHATFECLPSYVGRPLFQLLPFVEAAAYFNAPDPATPIAVYLCPVDSHANLGTAYFSYLINGGTCYRCADGAIDQSRSDSKGGFDARGVRYREVTDGLSNTVLFSERRAGIEPSSTPVSDQCGNDPVRCAWHLAGGMIAGETSRQFARRCVDRNQWASIAPKRYVEMRSLLNLNYQILYKHELPPNAAPCYGTPGGGAASYTLPATSAHSGGVNAAMLDGVVRFCSENTDLNVWTAMGSRASQETAEDP